MRGILQRWKARPNGTSPLDPQVIQLMQNISASIHQR